MQTFGLEGVVNEKRMAPQDSMKWVEGRWRWETWVEGVWGMGREWDFVSTSICVACLAWRRGWEEWRGRCWCESGF